MQYPAALNSSYAPLPCGLANYVVAQTCSGSSAAAVRPCELAQTCSALLRLLGQQSSCAYYADDCKSISITKNHEKRGATLK